MLATGAGPRKVDSQRGRPHHASGVGVTTAAPESAPGARSAEPLAPVGWSALGLTPPGAGQPGRPSLVRCLFLRRHSELNRGLLAINLDTRHGIPNAKGMASWRVADSHGSPTTPPIPRSAAWSRVSRRPHSASSNALRRPDGSCVRTASGGISIALSRIPRSPPRSRRIGTSSMTPEAKRVMLTTL